MEKLRMMTSMVLYRFEQELRKFISQRSANLAKVAEPADGASEWEEVKRKGSKTSLSAQSVAENYLEDLFQLAIKATENSIDHKAVVALKGLCSALSLYDIRNAVCHSNCPFPECYWYGVARIASDPTVQQLKFSALHACLEAAVAGRLEVPPAEWMKLHEWPAPNNLPLSDDAEIAAPGGQTKEAEELQKFLLNAAALSVTDLVRSVDIPPRPALLMALQHEMHKEDPHIKKVADLIRRDVAMAGSLLETSNSAFFNFRRRITTVEDAIAMIGMNQCGAVMTGLITRKVLARGLMMMARFWDVSEKRARAMSYVAKETQAVAPELAHSFGLFCDIGIPLLRARFPSYLETLSIANRAAAGRFTEVENTRHGINHVLVGALLATDWGISSDVVLAIRMHHEHEVLYDESVPVTVRALVAVNFVVEKAIQEYRGETESAEWAEGGPAAAEALGLSPPDVRGMCDELKSRFSGKNGE